jgi:hypothetical protein
MNSNKITKELERNKTVFKELLSNSTKEEYLWKPSQNKWCLLEIVCHLHDEEIEDFRARVHSVLDNPESSLTPIDPFSWVAERKYFEQDYNTKVDSFIKEREKSIKGLLQLKAPNWDNTYQHPQLGPLSAKLFLSNWLAHDYLHIRQILKVKFDYLKYHSGENLNYAGKW